MEKIYEELFPNLLEQLIRESVYSCKQYGGEIARMKNNREQRSRHSKIGKRKKRTRGQGWGKREVSIGEGRVKFLSNV